MMPGEADEQEQQTETGEAVAYVIPKGERCEIRAVVRPYQGSLLAELRVFVKRGDGTWMHTGHGVSLPVERAGEFLPAAQALAEAARSAC